MKARLLLFGFGALALMQCVAVLGAQTPPTPTPTLGDGLDATNLVWTTGGTGGVGWVYEASNFGDNTFDGIDSARSGHIGDNGETWFQTTVVGPGTVSYWWQAYSEPGCDWLEFYISSNRQARICGTGDEYSSAPSGWEYCSFPVPDGTNVLKWRYVKDGSYTGGTLDCAWVDRVSYATLVPPSVQVGLNTCGVEWITAGSVYTNGWFAQTNVTHDGKWAAQSGEIWHNQTNWLQATVSGVTNVSFWWKVSSESLADFLEFYTNGVLAKQISGEVNWQSNYFKLPSKTNTLTWLYRKDSSFTQGTNCGWIDQVAFSPAFKALPYALQTPTRLPDGRIQLAVAGEIGCPCRLEFSTDMIAWNQLTNFTTTNAGSVIIDPAAANSPSRYYRAVSP